MAEIKLTQVKGTGGGIPIGGLIPFEGGDQSFEFRGETYLRTGSLTPDVDNFPEAPRGILFENATLENTYNISTQTSDVKDIAVDSQGNVYVLALTTRAIHKYTADMSFIETLPTLAGASLNFITIDENDNLYGQDDDTLYRYDTSGTLLETYTQTFSFNLRKSFHVSKGIYYTGEYIGSFCNIYAIDLSDPSATEVSVGTIQVDNGHTFIGFAGYGQNVRPFSQDGTADPRVTQAQVRGTSSLSTASSLDIVTYGASPLVTMSAVGLGANYTYISSGANVYRYEVKTGVGISVELFQYTLQPTSIHSYTPLYMRIK